MPTLSNEGNKIRRSQSQSVVNKPSQDLLGLTLHPIDTGEGPGGHTSNTQKPDAAPDGDIIKDGDNAGEVEEVKIGQDDPAVRAAAQLRDIDPSAVRVEDKALEGERVRFGVQICQKSRKIGCVIPHCK